MEAISNAQIKLMCKGIRCEMKNTIVVLHNRLEIANKKVSEFQDKLHHQKLSKIK